MIEVRGHDPTPCRRQRSILRRESCDRGWSYVVSRIGELLPVQNGEAVNLFDNISHVDRCRRCAAFFHLKAEGAEIIGRDLREQPVLPDRDDIAIKDRTAHRASALRHPSVLEPALADSAKVLGNGELALLALLRLCR